MERRCSGVSWSEGDQTGAKSGAGGGGGEERHGGISRWSR